tara:strand:- start:1917 stop:2246 length:330 start_codon:yes stop_codon:yes gene_type:complete
MAVERLTTGKILIRSNNSVSKAIRIKEDDDVYGESYLNNNSNLNVDELANLLAEKMNVNDVNKSQAIDIDIKREIAIGKVDNNAVKSEVITGRVNNKLEKLKALRRNGS